MESEKSPQPEQNNEFNIYYFFQTIKLAKWSLVACIVGAALLATGIAFLIPKQYEAKLIANFSNQGKQNNNFGSLLGQFGGAAELAGISLGNTGLSQETYLAYLNSRSFIDSFIKEHELIYLLFDKQWDEKSKTWNVAPEKVPTAFRAYKLFSTKIFSTSYDKKTGIVAITVRFRDRDLAVKIANQIIEDANNKLRNQTIAETRRTIDYLEGELKKTSIAEVQNTIYRIMEAQIKTMMLANTQEQFAFKVIDPAASIDPDNFVSPRKGLIVLSGAAIGFFIGLALAFWLGKRRALKT